MKILLVEDEQKLADVLAKGLEHEGYIVDKIADGQKAFTRISLHRDDYDLVVLDLMLPSMDGYEICKQVRALNITIPILILTARAEVDTKVQLLLSGADDYLVKPFAFAELNARIQTLLRRPTETVINELQFCGIQLNPATRRVLVNSTEIPLTVKEFGLLEYFMRNPNQVVRRDDLLSHLWDFNGFVD